MNIADQQHTNYQAYLLRLWREGTQTPWHASLQGTSSEEMYHFATVEALFAFLDGRLKEPNHDAAVEPNRLQCVSICRC
jgi:hypothetical protein